MVKWNITVEDGNQFDAMAAWVIGKQLRRKAEAADKEAKELGCGNSRAHRDLYNALAEALGA